jgi:hypothetical protein
MITLGQIKTEMRNWMANATIASRIADWVYWTHVEMISQPNNFWWNRKVSSLSTVASTAEYILNYRCDGERIEQVTNNSVSNQIIVPTDLKNIYSVTDYTDTGDPINYSVVGVVGVQALSTAAGTCSAVSSGATDLSIICTVTGLVSGVITTDQISLNGTSSVAGTVSFDIGSITQVTLSGDCAGNVTVTRGAVTIVVIPAGNKRIQCPIIRFYYIPGSVQTINYIYQKKPYKIVDDDDVVDIPDFAFPTLLTGVEYWGHKNNGDLDFADATYQKFRLMIEGLATKGYLRDTHWKEFTQGSDGAIFTLPRTITYVVT